MTFLMFRKGRLIHFINRYSQLVSNVQHQVGQVKIYQKFENNFLCIPFARIMNNNRINRDIIGLINNKHVVQVKNLNKFTVLFNGPAETPYENGVWIVSVTVDEEYPFKPPIVKFITRIYHPNIDRHSGSICLNVLHENWSPIYDMVNVFEQFLPQLLKYPNADDPLNMYAAKLVLHRPTAYEQKVLEYVRRYACDKKKNEKEMDGEDVDDQNDDCTSSSSFTVSPSEVFDESMANKVN